MSEGEVVMLEIQELTKQYGKYLAVDHVSFQVPTGQVGILLGPNGDDRTEPESPQLSRVLQDCCGIREGLALRICRQEP